MYSSDEVIILILRILLAIITLILAYYTKRKVDEAKNLYTKKLSLKSMRLSQCGC